MGASSLEIILSPIEGDAMGIAANSALIGTLWKENNR
jgi:hypothetical protein